MGVVKVMVVDDRLAGQERHAEAVAAFRHASRPDETLIAAMVDSGLLRDETVLTLPAGLAGNALAATLTNASLAHAAERRLPATRHVYLVAESGDLMVDRLCRVDVDPVPVGRLRPDNVVPFRPRRAA